MKQGSSWSRDTQGKKGQTSTTGHLKDEDRFEALWKKRDVDPARVAITVAEGLDYGSLKVSATVSVACDQDEPSVNKAGELAFYKALELVRDGWRELNGEAAQKEPK